MKKIYFLLIISLGFAANAQIVTIPDANFKAKLLSSSPINYVAKNLSGIYFKIDSNNNSEIEIIEAMQVSYLNVSNSNISSLESINAFSNLKNITCNDNLISNLYLQDLLNLEYVFCNNNNLTTLDVSNLTNLLQLNCSSNQLTSLIFNNNQSLNYLSCMSNNLSVLDVSQLIGLQQLYVSNNFLQSLNLAGLNNLYSLICGNNLLSSLDLTGLNILYLNCMVNQLTSLDLSTLNLSTLSCSFNQLTSLDLGNMTNLGILYCNDNLLTELNLDGCLHLGTLNCSNNQITTLNLNSLVPPTGCIEGCPASINVSNNNLLSFFVKSGRSDLNIDFSQNPNIEFICTREELLIPLQNKANQYGYTNCNINSYCSFTPGGTFYTIQGNNRYDFNNNGCDLNDISFPNLKLNMTNGTVQGSVFGNSTGSYNIPVSVGTHNITPQLENPTYFNVSPTTSSVTFPTTASPYVQDFCITPNGIHNDLEVIVFPLSSALPGFDATYKIIYKNKGTHAQNGTVSLDFYDPIMDLVSVNPNFSSQSTNTLYWDFTNLLPFETREIVVVFNINSPTETPSVNAGNEIIYVATITGLTDETIENNTSTLHQVVVNSFDPNDKTCTEGTLFPTYKVGDYVNYIIRFENTGTANAQNVVVKDVINTTKLDISTLIPIDGSHEFYTRITNTNKVEFIFENIQLPFDDANNDGYIAFKIKTKSTLVDGDVFSNSANIYFDYNFPIVTNTYSTTVFNPLANSDFEFSNYIQLTPNPAKDVLNIAYKNDIEVSSISFYNALGQLVMVIPNANETQSIDVSQLTSGTYFIKVLSDKGSSSGKFIKQ